MKSAILIACAATLTALSACTPERIPGQPPVQRERQAYLTQTADIPVTCTAGPDCADKWARALEWVSRHSVYSIKTSTDSEIATNGPIEPTTDSAFTITKTQNGEGGYDIHFSSTCGQEVKLQTTAKECIPTSLELKSEFKNYLLYGIRNGNY